MRPKPAELPRIPPDRPAVRTKSGKLPHYVDAIELARTSPVALGVRCPGHRAHSRERHRLPWECVVLGTEHTRAKRNGPIPGGLELDHVCPESESNGHWRRPMTGSDDISDLAELVHDHHGCTLCKQQRAQLVAEIERLRDQLMQTCKPCLDKADEIEQLRAELADAYGD